MVQRQFVHACDTWRVVYLAFWSLCSCEQLLPCPVLCRCPHGYSAGRPSRSHAVAIFRRPSLKNGRKSIPMNTLVPDTTRPTAPATRETNHGSHSASKTAASESPQVPKDDGWNASRELPALQGCFSTLKSSWQPFPHTTAPTKPKVFQRQLLGKPAETQESRTFGHSSIFDIPRSRCHSSSPIWYLSQTTPFAASRRRDPISYEEDVSSIRDGYTAWVKADPGSIFERHIFKFEQCQSRLS